MADCFQIKTNVTALDIGLIMLLEAWPKVFPVNELSGFDDTKMHSQWVIVVATDKFCLNNLRDK